MFYEPGISSHGLPFDTFKSCVVPLPIGWISTTSPDDIDNLAPFSQFQNITFDPPVVMFSANQSTAGNRKDTVVNAETTGEFVWNMATWDLRHEVNATSGEWSPDVDEFERAGLTKAPSKLVRPPRVAQSPIQFECRYLQTVHIAGNGPMGSVNVVFGRVLGIHIADEVLTDGRIDIARIRPLARLGYYDYTTVDHVFTIKPPGSKAFAAGMEGSPEKTSR